MKFGANLAESQVPEWSAYYIDYKTLKKCIKSRRTATAGQDEQHEEKDSASQAQVAELIEVELLRLLDANVEKIDSFYNEKYAKLARKVRLQAPESDLLSVTAGANSARDALHDHLSSLLELRDDCRKLQWYSEVNRRGFIKITKKIDKNFAQFASNQRYLELQVFPRAFASHDSLSNDINDLQKWLLACQNLERTDQIDGRVSPAVAGTCNPLYEKQVQDVAQPTLASILKRDDHQRLLYFIESQVDDDDDMSRHRAVLHALERAMAACAFECIYQLLERSGDLALADDLDKRSAIHNFIIVIGRAKAFSSSLKNGKNAVPLAVESACYDVSSLRSQRSDDDDETMQYHEQRHAEVLQQVLDKLSTDQQAVLLLRDLHGKLPLHYAAHYGLCAMTGIMISRMKQWNPTGVPFHCVDALYWQDSDEHAPVHLSVMGRHPRTSAALLQSESDDGVSIRRQSRTASTDAALRFAVASSSSKLVRLLVDAGANVNRQNELGESALHLAARSGSDGCLQALLTASSPSCDLEGIDKTSGWTPLFHACANSHLSTVGILLAAGAQSGGSDAFGWTLLEHAMFNGHLAIVELLNVSKTPRPSEVDSAPFKIAKSLRTLMSEGRSISEQALELESIVLVSLGSMDMRNKAPIVEFDRASISSPAGTALSLVVSAQGAIGEPTIIDLPLRDDMSTIPISFTSIDPTKVKLVFDIIPTHARDAGERLGRAVGLLGSIAPSIGVRRVTLQGYLTVPILAASSLEVVGNVSFNFLIVKPCQYKFQAATEPLKFPKQNGVTVIGHRGLGKNRADTKNLQIGENTLDSFLSASKLGVPFVEFDIQLTKDHVPIVYHDFLVSETGIDAPVHALTVAQFMHANEAHELPMGHGSKGRFQARAMSVDMSNAQPNTLMENRMMFTKDYRENGYKANSRGKVVHAPFITLEKLLKKTPTSLGLNIELSMHACYIG